MDTWPYLLALTSAAAAVTEAMYAFGSPADFSLTPIPFTLVGVALSIFLGFRTNACYDRWWEARKLWGSLVNTTRSLARETIILVGRRDGLEQDAVRAFHREQVRRIIGLVYALKRQLRSDTPLSVVTAWVPPDEADALQAARNVPLVVLQQLGERYRDAWRAGWIDDVHYALLEESLTRLTDVQGACERIKNTPVPLSYTLLTHRLVASYCALLPLGIAKDVGHLTPLVVLFVSSALLGLDSVGTQLEDPFERDPNDLPLAAMARTIEINLLELAGETDLPEPLRPVGGILL